MSRLTVTTAAPPSTPSPLRRRLRRLHLGCGDKHLPGFFHIDIVDGPHVDHAGHVDDLRFIPDDTTELIYACHVLEHFGRYEVVPTLREWYRVLAPGGVLRLAVPDFAAVVETYRTLGLEDGRNGLVGLVCGGQRTPYDYHKVIFDKPYLTRLLHEAGFAVVRRWDWRTTDHADVDDYSQAYLPHLDKEHGRLMSLNLEAEKR